MGRMDDLPFNELRPNAPTATQPPVAVAFLPSSPSLPQRPAHLSDYTPAAALFARGRDLRSDFFFSPSAATSSESGP
jgi:hypothetical protein